jgi:hypothetical protein
LLREMSIVVSQSRPSLFIFSSTVVRFCKTVGWWAASYL